MVVRYEVDGRVVVVTLDRHEVANAIGVSGEEALRMGLANRLVPPGRALPEAIALAREIAARPQAALRSDRLSSYEQWSLGLVEALAGEYHHGMAPLAPGELFG